MKSEVQASFAPIGDTTSMDELEKIPPTSDGIYVLRTTQQNQVQLNLMADQKANIIIGVSLIFGTLAQRQIIQGQSDSLSMFVPLLMLGTTMLASFILAVLVVTPRLRRPADSTMAALSNPLFFGSFPAVDQKDFSNFLLENLEEPNSAREILIRDVYQTGCLLYRKYRLLRFAYLCLGTGVLVSVVATAIILLQSFGN